MFFVREEWFAGIAVGLLLALVTAFIHDVHRRGGFWKWTQRGIETADKFEEFLDRRVDRVGRRRLRRYDYEDELREHKRRSRLWLGQLKLFRR